MTDQKNRPEFYAARNDVAGGLLKKRSLRILRKHRAALMAPKIWQNEPNTDAANLLTESWLAAVNIEIDRRKEDWKKTAKLILVGVVVAVLGRAIYDFGTFALHDRPAIKQQATQQPSQTNNPDSNP